MKKRERECEREGATEEGKEDEEEGRRKTGRGKEGVATRRTSTKFIPGTKALTSLIALAFCVASILVRLTLKTVFSFGAATSSAAAEGAAAAGAAAAAGRAMSTMLRRVCERERGEHVGRVETPYVKQEERRAKGEEGGESRDTP